MQYQALLETESFEAKSSEFLWLQQEVPAWLQAGADRSRRPSPNFDLQTLWSGDIWPMLTNVDLFTMLWICFNCFALWTSLVGYRNLFATLPRRIFAFWPRSKSTPDTRQCHVLASRAFCEKHVTLLWLNPHGRYVRCCPDVFSNNCSFYKLRHAPRLGWFPN